MVDDQTNVVNDIADLWETDSLQDLKVVFANSDCPSGYEKLFLRVWPGTYEACDCKGVSSEYIPSYARNQVVIGECN